MTGGRGPDACIDAVGMEAHGTGLQYAYDRVKQALHLHTDRGRRCARPIMACRKGGTLSILGVYGVMDKFPIGVIMNKGLTVRTAQQHGQNYMPRLLEHAPRASSTRRSWRPTGFARGRAARATRCSSTRGRLRAGGLRRREPDRSRHCAGRAPDRGRVHERVPDRGRRRTPRAERAGLRPRSR